jgi:hypothetical protein
LLVKRNKKRGKQSGALRTYSSPPLDNAMVAVVSVASNGLVTSVNPAAVQLDIRRKVTISAEPPRRSCDHGYRTITLSAILVWRRHALHHIDQHTETKMEAAYG